MSKGSVGRGGGSGVGGDVVDRLMCFTLRSHLFPEIVLGKI